MACLFGGFQLAITLISLAQHVYSLTAYGWPEIFKCQYSKNATVSRFLQADFVIYDLGLYNDLWDIDSCIATQMDGGFMRSLWCLGYLAAVFGLYFAAFQKNPHRYILYPILTMQSGYCIGMLILTFSALPKVIKHIFENLQDFRLTSLIAVFIMGLIINYFLAYVVWHFFWHVEIQNKRKKLQKQSISLGHGHSRPPYRRGGGAQKFSGSEDDNVPLSVIDRHDR